MYYLYRFINVNDEIIYIGRTNDIRRRILKEHFTDKTHLQNECYLEIEKVEFVEIHYESEEVAYEAILINKYKPKYNVQFKDQGKFDIPMLEFNWKPFEWEYEGQLKFLKKKKRDTIQAIDVAENFLEYYCGSQKQMPVVTTGMELIDYIMPILPSSFTLIAGISGIGKTSYMLNIALKNAKRGKNILYINLKDSEENLIINLISMDSQISKDKIIKKGLSYDEWGIFNESVMRITKESISFYNKNGNYLQLDEVLRIIKQNDADIVLIDDLDMIEHERNNYVKDRMDYILKSIKAIALQYSIPIIGSYCIPRNRVMETRMDKRPVIADLEYNSLTKYPDNIQMLYLDEDNNNNSAIMEIITTKNAVNSKHSGVRVACVNGKFVEFETNEEK